MEITESDLRQRYELLVDEELLALFTSGDLTNHAQSVLADVLTGRGLNIDVLSAKNNDAEAKVKPYQTIGFGLVCIGAASVWNALMKLFYLIYYCTILPAVWNSLFSDAGSGGAIWVYFLLSEIVAHIGMLVTWTYVIYLFFTRKRLFPHWFIGIVLFEIGFIVSSTFLECLAYPGEPVWNLFKTQQLFPALGFGLIWILCLRRPNRVGATFVR